MIDRVYSFRDFCSNQRCVCFIWYTFLSHYFYILEESFVLFPTKVAKISGNRWIFRPYGVNEPLIWQLIRTGNIIKPSRVISEYEIQKDSKMRNFGFDDAILKINMGFFWNSSTNYRNKKQIQKKITNIFGISALWIFKYSQSFPCNKHFFLLDCGIILNEYESWTGPLSILRESGKENLLWTGPKAVI